MSIYATFLTPENKRVFQTPSDFLAAAAEYFTWAEASPLLEEQLFAYQGEITREDVSKLRSFSQRGMASYLGMPVSRLNTYLNRDDIEWNEAAELVAQIIYQQQYDAAAAGLLNAGIITRSLGLADKKEVSGPDGTPLTTITAEMSVDEAAQAYADMRSRSRE